MKLFAFVLAAATLSASAHDAVGQGSSLTVSPAQPQQGQEVTVQYKASDRLANEKTLVLRARIRTADATDGEHAVLGRLERVADRTFRAKIRLPGQALYCVFAVEDTAASEVDAGGELWEIRVHDKNGRPRLESMQQQYSDLSRRQTRLAANVAEEMVKLYPRSAHANLLQLFQQLRDARAEQRDSVVATHRTRLAALLPHTDSLTERTITDVVFYADNLGDTATARVWRDRLFRLHPASRAAKQQRVFELSASKQSRAEKWEAMERLYQSDSTFQAQLLFSAFQSAQVAKDVEQIRHWGERLIRTPEFERAMIIPAYMTYPELKAEGMDHIRVYVKQLADRSDELRPLTQTRAEFAAMHKRWTSTYLAQLGQALADAGKEKAALDTLSIAADFTWSPTLFRTVVKSRLAMNDTAGALPLLARIAADPLTAPSFTDSVFAQYGARIDQSQWSRWKAEAVSLLTKHVMLAAADRAAGKAFRVVDPTGSRHAIDPRHTTETFVAYFSRHCVPSLLQLTQLDGMIKQMRERGVRVVAITEEDATPELQQFLREKKLSFDFYFDPDREARRSLDLSGTPTYLLLDRSGKIRFESHALDDISRQLWLVRETDAAAVSKR